MSFQNIIIIGLGLIGGSIAKACKKKHSSIKIFAFDKNSQSLQFALKNNIIDDEFNFSQKIPTKSLIIVASPLKAYNEIFTKLKPIIIDDTIIIDAGSVKEKPTEIADKALGKKAAQFIPCHPIAGSEKSGIKNADVDLFKKKAIYAYTKDLATKFRLKEFFEKIGFLEIHFFNKNQYELNYHDERYAMISHLPQLLSFLLKENFKTKNEDIIKHLRLQNSNKNLWKDIFKFNKQAINHTLDLFLKEIKDFIHKLKHREINFLHDYGFKCKNNFIIDINFDQFLLIFLKADFIMQMYIGAGLDDIYVDGTGLKDFISILKYQPYIKSQLEKPINKNKIIDKLEEYSKKIKNYQKL